MATNARVLLSGREFKKLLLRNAGQALLAAILLLAVVAGFIRNLLFNYKLRIMSKEKILWTMKNGSQIDIDNMTIDHLRNTLKMIVRQNQSIQKKCPHNINDAMTFSDEEVSALTNKSQYQFENEENIWK